MERGLPGRLKLYHYVVGEFGRVLLMVNKISHLTHYVDSSMLV